ncbi:MAG: type VI secretion system ATPase TssH [Deltaproteobacteria bacterium]|jgi:type VI secretion system protein VasG|nr:type VI secretion system ATPase TssH [Deltaproteobacteria bacterium]
MFGSDIKSLIAKLNTVTTKALYEAGGLAVGRTHYEVAVEHLLLKATEEPGDDLSLIFDSFKVDKASLRNTLNKSLESFNSGNSGRPTFSPVLLELLEAAWVTASVDLGLSSIRTGAVILAFLRRPSVFSQGGPIPELNRISKDELAANFAKILAASSENGPELSDGEKTAEAAAAGSGESFIGKFCENFTAKAKKGEIDPVFGRDHEIRSIINILARRRKNNPILVGEPGVGKTAVIEGLARRIVEGDVPDTLNGVTLLSLDMGLLEAGASVKGEFERRLKGVIDEVKASPVPIILFIDEAHTLIGAGGQAGGSDAANLLKPALARGELKTCAATTWKEYKKYFEKDAALARRFQLVNIDEPSSGTCLIILRGLKDFYEKSHGLFIRDEALKAAAVMSDRYISGRFLPDKAVDLLDTACARVKVGLAAKPSVLEDAQRILAAQNREKTGLIRDEATGPVDTKRLAALDLEIEKSQSDITRLTGIWAAQKEAALAVIAARDKYLALKKEAEKAAAGTSPGQTEGAPAPKAGPAEKQADPNEAPAAAEDQPAGQEPEQAPDIDPPAEPAEETPDDPVAAGRAALEAAEQKRRALSLNQPDELQDLIDIEVTEETVAKVVSDWTGIPLGRLAAQEAQTVNNLAELVERRIKGQGQAVAAIVRVIQAAKAGLKDPHQPMGVFLMVGPSGVGKTETGLTLAELLFGDEKNIVTVNMSEFQEKHTVSRLVGSPPGYVGYGEGGLLTEAVRQKPYSVILLDECEKAHIDVMNIFYQVFDKGVLTDAEGKAVNFANTIILMASNLASGTIEKLSAASPAPTLESLTSSITPELSSHFRPALLARMNIVPYRSLDREALINITALKLAALAKRLSDNNRTRLIYGTDVIEAIADRCDDSETGARNIDHILTSGIMPRMAQDILKHLSEGKPSPDSITLDLDENQSFRLAFRNETPDHA